jgi:uncharacterized membrane protein YphA (DoxX/SURF4 family)
MGDIEEVLSREYYLIDMNGVRYRQVLLLIISLLIFALYGTFLEIVCSISPNIFLLLLLIGSQVGLGLPLTRSYYGLGISTRKLMKIYDIGLQGAEEDMFDLRINMSDLPRVFERLEMQISKYDVGKMDDLTDVSWFIVIVWAIVSSIAHYIGFFGQTLCIFGVVVLIVASLLSFISGYWTKGAESFEENLQHLEYYIGTLAKKLDSVLPNQDAIIILQLVPQRRRSSLADIGVEFIIEERIILKYHFGLTSERPESFSIEAPYDLAQCIYERLLGSNLSSEGKWTIEQETTNSGASVRIVNCAPKLNISEKRTYISDPAAIEQISRETWAVLGIVTISVHSCI